MPVRMMTVAPAVWGILLVLMNVSNVTHVNIRFTKGVRA